MSNEQTSKETRYGVRVEGVVQDVGLRDYIEDLGQKRGLRGYVLNNGDAVGIVVDGPRHEVNKFIEEIQGAEEDTMTNITDITSNEISREFAVPDEFRKLTTDDLADIGRKLDEGVNHLSSLDERQMKMAETQEKMAENLGSVDDKQGEMVSLLSDIKDSLTNAFD